MPESLTYETLADFIGICLRLPYIDKRFIEGLLKACNSEYDIQKKQNTEPLSKIKEWCKEEEDRILNLHPVKSEVPERDGRLETIRAVLKLLP